MFAHRNPRTFLSAPQSLASLVAAIAEPLVTVLVYWGAQVWDGDSMGRQDLTLCLLVFALTFPGTNRFRDKLIEAAVDIVVSWVQLLAILALFAFATRSRELYDPEVIAFWVVATPIAQLVVVRIGQLVVRRQARERASLHRAVIIGAGALGVKVRRTLAGGLSQRFEFAGYFDDRADERVDPDAAARRLGALKDAAPYIRAHAVKDVFITLPLGSQPRIVELLEDLQGTTASIYYVPDVFGISVIQGRLLDLNGVPMVGLCETPFTGTNLLVKRVSDLVLASIILVLVSPLLLAIAVGVKLSSPGPVIFRQRRNGLDGEEITVYKFRSMRAMDDGDVVPQAKRDDPRTTRFGAFIRRTSLDELPQLFNVLQGRMSIVGPRPHAIAHNEQYRRLIKAYMVRHKVRPGITGWAQVNGHRGETETIEKMQSRIEYDLEYLRNWSLAFDLRIMARTIKVMFADVQAY